MGKKRAKKVKKDPCVWPEHVHCLTCWHWDYNVSKAGDIDGFWRCKKAETIHYADNLMHAFHYMDYYSKQPTAHLLTKKNFGCVHWWPEENMREYLRSIQKEYTKDK